MIRLVQGNLLKSDAEALVNTVNAVGVMGKGIALQFKKAFPDNFKVYEAACAKKEVRTGKMFITETGLMHGPRFIVNFPTKRHWKGKSRIEDIESGLQALTEDIRRLGIHSIAVPPLGCGLGGLDWDDVYSRIVEAFSSLPEVDVRLFTPDGTPKPTDMPNNTKKPPLTKARAAFLGVLASYAGMLYEPVITLLEAQKLSYFLQEAGEPLRLNFVKWHYGPYADNLRHVLNELEGHYLLGWGAGANRPLTPLQILPSTACEAVAFLKEQFDTMNRFRRVASLVEGFESAHGMELLATVHWVAVRELGQDQRDTANVLKAVSAWTERKCAIFKAPHIEAAMQQLTAHRWL